ncbi:YtxH domain-containing protein [Patescibacteria group bacterium]
MAKKTGLFLGLLAGTALGILFAPKKGKVMRDKIKKELDEGGYGLEAVKEGFVGMGKEVVDTAKEAYETDEVQEQIGKAKDVAEEYMEEGKKRAKKAVRKYERKAKTTVSKVKKRATKTAKKAGRKAKAFTKKKIGK